jgi:deoxyribodipyrimidine photo-lyase
VLFWFRRDLRLKDNAGLYRALKSGHEVRPIFIFDRDILDALPSQNDFRLPFLLEQVKELQRELREKGSDLEVYTGNPVQIFTQLLRSDLIQAVYTNHDYEPKAIARDQKITHLVANAAREFHSFKDQVIFEKDEVLTDARKPYTVYTPYKKKWLASLSPFYLQSYPSEKYLGNLQPGRRAIALPNLKDLGFTDPQLEYPPPRVPDAILKNYDQTRDFPALEKGTSHLGMHLRFGTISVRHWAQHAKPLSPVWLSELIWREFFMQILHHFPHVEKSSFRLEYENVAWRNSPADFQKWQEGRTGYPSMTARRRLTADHSIEKVGSQLRAMMPWIAKNKLVDQSRN